MSIKPENGYPDFRMDAADLYREEAFTDRRMGTIRRLSPVKPDGSPDPARRVVYMGETQLLTSAGALPLSFEISANSLDEAAVKYSEDVKRARLQRTILLSILVVVVVAVAATLEFIDKEHTAAAILAIAAGVSPLVVWILNRN